MVRPETSYAGEHPDRLRRLAGEHAAIARIASLITRGAPGAEPYAAVVEEVVRVLGVSGGWLVRYEPDRSITVLASVNDGGFTAGSRWQLDGPSVSAMVLDTGLPARIDDYAGLGGTISARTHASGFRSVSGVPIAVDGALWGMIAIGTKGAETLPDEADTLLRSLTEIVASAIAGVESRERVRRLADGQAALRRVATLVAEGGAPAELFAAIAQEAAQVVGVPAVALLRYEPAPATTVVAAVNAPGFPIGRRMPVEAGGFTAAVIDSGRPARTDGGEQPADVRAAGLHRALGVPIVVEARMWGLIVAGTAGDEPLPADARLRDFAELVAIAISNAESRNRLRGVADQQAALRRVATLVAEGAPPHQIFAGVAEEVARILDASSVAVIRFEPDRVAVVVASVNDPDLPVGSRWPPDGPRPLFAALRESGRPARTGAGVGVPIVVDGTVWGAVTVGSREQREALPRFTGSYTGRIVLSLEPAHAVDERLAAFTVVATAISKAQADDELRRLAEEQAAMRRVATLVAEGAPPNEIFAGVAEEVARILELPRIEMVRYEDDRSGTVIGATGDHPFPVGTRWAFDGPSVMARIHETDRPARIDDYSALPGTIAETAREAGFRSAIGAPIIVDGRTWGAIIAISTLPVRILERSEARLSQFTALVATAVSNATARADLLASRARIVTAGDEARRRLERNLHDGTQQRLLAIQLDLQRIRSATADAEARTELETVEHDITSALDEVRELSRGLHPGVLSRGGLPPSLNALARRSPIAVDLEVDLDERPPAPVETAVYYVVSEALANAIRHSRASAITVRVARTGATVRATVVDDGAGGAVAEAGSGLTGLQDRVEAIGGDFTLQSPPGRGTTISIELPI